MKKVLLMLMFVLGCGISADAQIAIKGGLGVTNLTGDADTDATFHWKIGAGYEFRINELIGIEPNAFLVGKGADYGNDYTWSPIYLELPVMCNFHLGDNWTLGAGAYLAPLLSDDDAANVKNMDYGMRIGARYGFDSGFELGVDTSYGLNNVFDTKHYDCKHLSLSLTCGYRF